MVESAQSAVAGGEHTIYRSPTGHLFSAGACGLGWCRNLPTSPSLFGFRRVASISEPVRLFHAGYYHNLAVGASSGKLYSWGCGTFCDGGLDGSIPAFGRGVHAEDVGGPPEVVPMEDGEGAGVVGMAGGAYHSAVLLQSGRILTFGAGQLGQLARSPRHVDQSGLPVDADPAPAEGLPPSETATGIGGGFYNTFARCKSGKLFCSGENQNQQCGRGPSNFHRFSHVKEVSNVAGVSGGYCHTLVRTLDGVIYSLGCGDDGQRGDGKLEVDEEESGEPMAGRPVVSKVPLPGNKRADAVAAGANHSVVLSSDGVAYTFGANDVGQCGVPNYTNNENNSDVDDEDEPTAIATPTEVHLPTGSGRVVEISAGYAHTVVRTDRGKVHVFGQNSNGQLGLGRPRDGKAAEDPALEPVEIDTAALGSALNSQQRQTR